MDKAWGPGAGQGWTDFLWVEHKCRVDLPLTHTHTEPTRGCHRMYTGAHWRPLLIPRAEQNGK